MARGQGRGRFRDARTNDDAGLQMKSLYTKDERSARPRPRAPQHVFDKSNIKHFIPCKRRHDATRKFYFYFQKTHAHSLVLALKI